MSFRMTIQLIKLNAKLPKDESNIRYHLRIVKSAFNLLADLLFEPKKKRNIYMRLFDTLDPISQIDLLSKSVQFAKREIADFGNPTNRSIEDIATDYVWQDGVIAVDYTRIDILTIPAWTGPLPIKFPRP
jgi:hypothetical protein